MEKETLYPFFSPAILFSLMQIPECHVENLKAVTIAILLFEWWLGRQNLMPPKSTLSLGGTILMFAFWMISKAGVAAYKLVFRRNTNG